MVKPIACNYVFRISWTTTPRSIENQAELGDYSVYIPLLIARREETTVFGGPHRSYCHQAKVTADVSGTAEVRSRVREGHRTTHKPGKGKRSAAVEGKDRKLKKRERKKKKIDGKLVRRISGVLTCPQMEQLISWKSGFIIEWVAFIIENLLLQKFSLSWNPCLLLQLRMLWKLVVHPRSCGTSHDSRPYFQCHV